ncbi:MAG: hypothetical protein GY762_19585, partial [Proteobacteria bacterium]|nr:hypothetical protein [Pseudomonadota bacterium]
MLSWTRSRSHDRAPKELGKGRCLVCAEDRRVHADPLSEHLHGVPHARCGYDSGCGHRQEISWIQVASRIALGPDSGKPIPKLTDHAAATPGQQSLPPLTSNEQGYSLHAATHIPANDRALRERLCRYISRPPLAQGRLSLTDE